MLPAGIQQVQIQIAPDGAPLLRYDSDGNGSLDQTLPPTVQLNGAAATDQSPPNITMTMATTAEVTSVEVLADDPSGIQQLLFSTDGETFEPYTGPVVLLSQTTPLVVIADDRAGNRQVARFSTPDHRVFLPALSR